MGPACVKTRCSIYFQHKNNGKAIVGVCREFVGVCRRLELFSQAIVAIDGSKFKAVNNRDNNFTEAKMKKRLERVEKSIARYLSELDKADRAEPAVAEAKSERYCQLANVWTNLVWFVARSSCFTRTSPAAIEKMPANETRDSDSHELHGGPV